MANRTVSVILQAEIGQYVSGMTKAAAATKGLGETAETTSTKANKGFDLAGRGAQLFGLAAAGALVGVITKSMEFEKAMSAVQAATQASASTMGDLRAAAIKAGADTQYSATEAAQGITEMAKAGVSAKDIIGGGLTGVLSLAAAGQLEVADAAGIASTAMTQFSLSGAQIPHVADLLAAGAGKAMGSVDDLGQALNQAGLLASSTGISIEETTGTLAAFASAGLIGSDAGTSFKTMLQQLQNPSKESAELMQQLGINAYDAQGKFVGLADLAQQLKSHLGNLTQAQRDQALAQIFGSDAARAATVLYREGAAGIDEWTKKVNDAGYAQRQAADLTDNLAGDLERLGGSFDTLLISIGQGLQGPLRGFVQMLGGLVDGIGGLIGAFGALPAPLQIAIGAFAAWAAIGGKVTSFFETAALKTLYLKDSLSGLGGVAGTAKAAIGSVASAVGPELIAALAAGGIALVANGFDKIVNAGQDAKDEIDQINDSLKDMGNAERIDATTGSIHQLQASLAAAQATLGSGGGDQGLLASFLGFQFVADGSAASMDNAQSAVDAYQKAIADLEAKQNMASDTADVLAGKMGMTRDEVLQLADAAGVDLSQGLGTAQGQLLMYRDAQDAASGSTAAASSTAEVFATNMEGVKQSADDAKTATDNFKLSLDILTGAHITLAEAQSAMYAALDEATTSLDDQQRAAIAAAGSLDLTTEAGRKGQQTLIDIKDAGNQYISTMIQQGATTADVQAADAQLRDSFIKSAMQMGLSQQAAETYADQILGIPADRTTKINADVSAAQNAISNTQTQIDNLHGKTVTITMTANGTVAAILGDPNQAHSRGTVIGYAEGGYTGPGSKYQPAGIVHAGEVVFSQADVAAHGGVGAVERLRTSRMPGYADGGPVIQINTDDAQVAASVAAARSAVTKMMTASAPGPGSGAARWAGTILRVLAELGVPASALNGVENIISHESGGNPNAINLTDSNARAGHPSQGLMQTIPGTFNAYAGPYRSLGITNPLANIYAGVNYALHRYGAAWLARGGNMSKLGGYKGYATGTDFVPETGPAVLHKGEAVLTREQGEAYRAGLRSREVPGAVAGGGGGSVSVAPPVVKVFLDGQEWRGMARVEAEGVVVDFATGATTRARNNA